MVVESHLLGAGMHKTLRLVTAAAVLAVLCALPVESVWAHPAVRISLSSPAAYQVFQRGTSGRGAIVVRGVASGFSGPVQVRWGSSPWSRARRRADGSFSVLLRGLRPGQAVLRVRSARRHRVRASRARVSVGDIYVIAGQSNASGRSSRRFVCRHPSLRAAMFGNDDRWGRLVDPVDSPAGQRDWVSRDPRAGGSVWPLVAATLMRADRVPVAFVPCARAASGQQRWARPARLTSQSLYGSMARRVRAVGGRVRAVLFWQGEADARDPAAATAYRGNLLRFAADVRRDFRAPLVVAQIGDYGRAYRGELVDVVRRAQAASWGRPGIVAGPVLYDIDLEGVVHFDAADDMATAARRWAAAILSGVLRRGAPASPRLRAAELAGREVLLTADGGLAAAATTRGFVVRDEEGQVDLEDSFVDDEGRVHLVLARDPDGEVTVSLGEGRTAAGAAVPVEPSAWRLPLQPFVDRPVSVLPADGS